MKRDHIKYGYIQRKETIVLTPGGRKEIINIGEPIRTATRCKCGIGKNHESNIPQTIN